MLIKDTPAPTTKSRSQLREGMIAYVYGFELMGETFSHIPAFENYDFSNKEIKLLEQLEKNYDKYKMLVSKFLSNNWTMDRIAPLERAILIFGAFELSFTENKNMAINELVSYAKFYILGDNYKFINAVLDKVGAYYEQIKSNKKAD